MLAERGPRAAAPSTACSLGVLRVLHEDAVVEVLRAAKGAGALASLAATSRQLCSLARGRVPVRLSVRSPAQAQLVLLSHARGRPPFSGCTELVLAADNPSDCLLAAGILGVAQQWSALREVRLLVCMEQEVFHQEYLSDCCLVPLLNPLPAFKQLRRLDLTLPSLGACIIRHVGQLVQLTRLELGLASEAAGEDTRLDLLPWSGLTNLRELEVGGAPSVQPAASVLGPYCLPSSLTSLALRGEWQHPAVMACWVTHLPGCPQLQEVVLEYCKEQAPSAHPSVVARLLAQHTPRLRTLLVYNNDGPEVTTWEAVVEGLPGETASPPVEWEWRPDAALAALTGLEFIDGGRQLTIDSEAGWLHLAQLTALTELVYPCIHYAPPLQTGTSLCLLQLSECRSCLGGHDLGRLLLACPLLHIAEFTVDTPLAAPAPTTSSQPQLTPHPKLESLWLYHCGCWGSAGAAMAQWRALAPVLQSVSHLTLHDWPTGSSSSSSSSSSGGGGGSSSSGGATGGVLPDLSPCTALISLNFGSPRGDDDDSSSSSGSLVEAEQEEYLCMLAPLVQPQRLQVYAAPRLNARAVLVLQGMLPHLRYVELVRCGRQLPLAPAGSGQQQEQQALGRVKQLLRPGLVLWSPL